ncbi:MAG: hypothetical protein OXN97_08250 [Bryobacterales bacterium]|nr:hypothetical protein [Bryobacterales bacterium]MDE0629835.1 hypothetical protein [Bryobacterales bacterium]
MPRFRVFHLVADRSEAFRSKAPAKPPYVLRRFHYEDGPVVSADSPYALWKEMRGHGGPHSPAPHRRVDVGDAVEADGQLLLCNYWGFDPAQWHDTSNR